MNEINEILQDEPIRFAGLNDNLSSFISSFQYPQRYDNIEDILYSICSSDCESVEEFFEGYLDIMNELNEMDIPMDKEERNLLDKAFVKSLNKFVFYNL